MLYIRMFIILIVSLFTVRLLLKSLGVVDYGIYNVVGSVVSLFAFLNYTLSIATQRYFSMELATNQHKRLNDFFNLFVRLYFALTIIIIVFAESIGLWLLHYHLKIPPERFWAAQLAFHTSVIAFAFNMLTVPYQAMIIAYERMKVFAFISLFEAALKLGIVILLLIISIDKLVTYGFLVMISSFIISGIYFITVHRIFNTCKLYKFWDSNQIKNILSFSGWNIFGALAGVLTQHGVNLLINIFFGPIFNAARGISQQANIVINQFVTNFTTAVNPQITKLYALRDKENMQNLVYQSSKFSFFLILTISVPILFETEFFLSLWLGTFPKYTALFLKLIILNTLIDVLSYPFQTAVQATGRIKFYQIVVGGLMLLNLPLSFLLYKLGATAEYCFIVGITISLICLVVRLIMLRNLLQFSIKTYFNQYIIRYFTISFIVFFLYLNRMHTNFHINPLFLIIFEIILVASIIYLIGIKKAERKFIKEKLSLVFQKMKNHVH
ncbi:MAG: MATE family efflux transporter [Bacteroidales bacterium]|nr:MATE family efflux transporter [Bacteroidales bacterium]